METAQPRWKDEPEARGIPIRVITEMGDIPAVRGTQSGLYDMLINLLFNAIDAMPEGGTITIATKTVGEVVQISVQDTGTGMDEEIRKKIFEPFFTTKVDVGSGLGLATVYGTVSRWGGDITVRSEPGQGSAFILNLPVWSEPEPEEPISQRMPGRRGKILVVDDEPELCEILSLLLSPDHDVTTAESGSEALDNFQLSSFDVVLLDLGMPEMPGDWVASRMKQIDSTAALVLTTGWKLAEDDRRLSQFDFQLQKPFRGLKKINEIVAQALELHDERAKFSR